jgi:hypothetical protein
VHEPQHAQKRQDYAEGKYDRGAAIHPTPLAVTEIKSPRRAEDWADLRAGANPGTLSRTGLSIERV